MDKECKNEFSELKMGLVILILSFAFIIIILSSYIVDTNKRLDLYINQQIECDGNYKK